MNQSIVKQETTAVMPSGFAGGLATPPSAQTSAMMVEQTKAVAEVFAAVQLAQMNPRDEQRAHTRIMASCQRASLARTALYKYPRGGQQVTGPSIRLAETICRSWGNIRTGVKEIESNDDYTILQAFAHDLETNVLEIREFKVQHSRKAGGRIQKLTDPRDVYEHTQNFAARRKRAAILAVIPQDIVDDAVMEIEKTLTAGASKLTPEERARKMLIAFKEIGVDQGMLELRLGHKLDLMDAEEFVDMQSIYQSIKDKQAKREDYFDYGSKRVSKDAVDSKIVTKKKTEGTEK